MKEELTNNGEGGPVSGEALFSAIIGMMDAAQVDRFNQMSSIRADFRDTPIDEIPKHLVDVFTGLSSLEKHIAKTVIAPSE